MRKLASLVTLGIVATASAALAANSLTVINNPLKVNNTTNKVLSVNHSGGATNNVFVEDQSPNNEKHFLVKFWINPSTLANVANKSVRIGMWGSDGNGFHVILFLKRNDADSSWRVNTWFKEDASGYKPGPGVFIVSQAAQNQWRQVQVEWTAATSNGANNGTLTIKRTAPTTSGTIAANNLDTDILDVDVVRYGSLAGQGSNATGGAYLFDEYESYR